MIKVPLPLNAGTKRKHKTLPLSTSTKRKHETQAQNASSNGGDASRVGENAMLIHYKQRLTDSTNYSHVCEPLS